MDRDVTLVCEDLLDPESVEKMENEENLAARADHVRYEVFELAPYFEGEEPKGDHNFRFTLRGSCDNYKSFKLRGSFSSEYNPELSRRLSKTEALSRARGLAEEVAENTGHGVTIFRQAETMIRALDPLTNHDD